MVRSGLSQGWIYAGGALAISAPFVVYLATLAPGITFEDAGELITAAATLGIPHPSGYPVFALWGHLFTLLPFKEYAWRVNCASAAAAAMSCGVVYGVVRRLGRSGGAAGCVAGLSAAAAWAASRTLWSQSVVAEVYAPAILAAALALAAAVEYVKAGDTRNLYAAALAGGVTAAAHPFYLTVVIVALGYACWAGRRLSPAAVWGGLLFVTLGASAYLYIPLRAAQSPLLNWGDARTAPALVNHLTRRMYGGPDLDRLPFVLAHWREWAVFSWREFGAGVILVAAAWLAAGWREDRKLWITLGIGVLLTGPLATVALVLSLHTHQLFGIEVWYLPFSLIAAVALGLAFSGGWAARNPAARIGVAGAMAAIPLFSFFSNLPPNNYRRHVWARDFGGDFLRTVGYRGQNLVFEGSSLGVFEIAYYKKVEGKRPDHDCWDTTGRVFPPGPAGTWDDAVEESLLCASPATYYTALRAEPLRCGYSLEPAGLLFRADLIPSDKKAPSAVWGRYAWKDAVSGVVPRPLLWRLDPAARAAWIKYRIMWASETFLAGDKASALEALASARNVATGLPEELGEIGVTYMMWGEPSLAAAAFGEAAAAVPRGGRGDLSNRMRYAGFKNNQATAAWVAGDAEGAAAAWAASLAVYPEQSDIRRWARPEGPARDPAARKR